MFLPLDLERSRLWLERLPRSLQIVCNSSFQAADYWEHFRWWVSTIREGTWVDLQTGGWEFLTRCLNCAEKGESQLAIVGDEFAAISGGPNLIHGNIVVDDLSWHHATLRKFKLGASALIRNFNTIRVNLELGMDCWTHPGCLEESTSEEWNDKYARLSEAGFDEGEFLYVVRSSIDENGDMLMVGRPKPQSFDEWLNGDLFLNHDTFLNYLLIEAAKVGLNRKVNGIRFPQDDEPDNSDADRSLSFGLKGAEGILFQVLENAKRRLTTNEILDELSRMGGKEYGESTVKGRLAAMVKQGLIDNRSDTRPRGYSIVRRNGPQSIP